MNRAIKNKTVKQCHYDKHDQLCAYLSGFESLNGLTPYEFICKTWTSEPERSILKPIHQLPGVNA